MRFLYLLLALLLLIGCEKERTETDVYRGTEDGTSIQKVIVTTFDPEGTKSARTLRKYRYNRQLKTWIPIGGPRNVLDADTSAETANLSSYPGDQNSAPSATATTPNNLYLANNFGQNSVLVLNADTLADVARIPVQYYMAAMTAAPDGLTVAFTMRTVGASQVRIIDVLTNTITRNLNLPAGSDPKSISYSPDGSLLYVADSELGIHVITANPLTLRQTIPRPSGIVQLSAATISPNGDLLVVRSAGSASLSIFDTTTLTFTSPVSTGRFIVYGEQPCAFHPAGHEFYCLVTDGIGFFDTATMTGITSIPLPRTETVYRFQTFDGGNYLFLTTDKAVRMINVLTRSIESTLSPPSSNLTFTNTFPLL